MDQGLIFALIIAAAVVGGTCYFIFFRKKASTEPVAASGWTFQYSVGMPAQMTKASDGSYFFDFPSRGGVHYVVQKAPTLSASKTVTMSFSLVGTGDVVPSQTDDQPPGTVRLYFQRRGDDLSGVGAYQQYRYFGIPMTNLVNGDYTVSVPLTPDQWTDVFGKKGTDYPSAFSAALADPIVIGFVCGGQFFAGHGAFVKNGTARFVLKSFTVQ